MDINSSIDDTLQCEADIINNLQKSVSKEQLVKVVNAIHDCKGKIITTGCGTSGTAAQKIAHTLCCIECPACFLSPANALHGGLGLVQKNDIVIMISKGGNTNELDKMMLSCRVKGVTVIVVTETQESLLADKCDILLKLKVEKEPDDFNMLATGSTLAVIAVFDAISIAVMRLKNYSKDDFLLIHPGGDVGKRLYEGKA